MQLELVVVVLHLMYKMRNKNFPTLIVDSFLENPDQLVDYSKTLEYSYSNNYAWPGEKTKSLHQLDNDLFVYLGTKMLNCYNIEFSSWKGRACFQKVDKKYSKGWVHYDTNVLTGILYLNKQVKSSCGTSLYDVKKMHNQPIYSQQKGESFEKLSKDSEYELTEEDNFYLNENNNLFEENLIVKNIYNRLFLFEGSFLHSANNFCNDEPRLTLTFFFDEINVIENKYPLGGFRNGIL